ncbi:MAG TPA: hypothetical protein VGJ22_13225 [Anaerolineales bacterium]
MPGSNRSHEDILFAEFEYAARTASQANEDRVRVASFYLIAVGSLVAALFSTQFFGPDFRVPQLSLLFSGLFFVLTLLGSSTVLQLARLRAAWYESALAMNQIKDYALKKDRKLAEAFRWRTDSLPPLYKPSSISFLQALEVALLSSLTFGAAAYFLQAGLGYTRCIWALTPLLGLLSFLAQLAIYKRSLFGANKKGK